jgi:hypothetical protein
MAPAPASIFSGHQSLGLNPAQQGRNEEMIRNRMKSFKPEVLNKQTATMGSGSGVGGGIFSYRKSATDAPAPEASYLTEEELKELNESTQSKRGAMGTRAILTEAGLIAKEEQSQIWEKRIVTHVNTYSARLQGMELRTNRMQTAIGSREIQAEAEKEVAKIFEEITKTMTDTKYAMFAKRLDDMVPTVRFTGNELIWKPEDGDELKSTRIFINDEPINSGVFQTALNMLWPHTSGRTHRTTLCFLALGVSVYVPSFAGAMDGHHITFDPASSLPTADLDDRIIQNTKLVNHLLNAGPIIMLHSASKFMERINSAAIVSMVKNLESSCGLFLGQDDVGRFQEFGKHFVVSASPSAMAAWAQFCEKLNHPYISMLGAWHHYKTNNGFFVLQEFQATRDMLIWFTKAPDEIELALESVVIAALFPLTQVPGHPSNIRYSKTYNAQKMQTAISIAKACAFAQNPRDTRLHRKDPHSNSSVPLSKEDKTVIAFEEYFQTHRPSEVLGPLTVEDIGGFSDLPIDPTKVNNVLSYFGVRQMVEAVTVTSDDFMTFADSPQMKKAKLELFGDRRT